jgi:hypothetical protein
MQNYPILDSVCLSVCLLPACLTQELLTDFAKFNTNIKPLVNTPNDTTLISYNK